MIPSRTEQEKISTTRQPTNNPPIQPEGQSMQYAIANLQGLGTRDQQQDAFAFGNALDEDAIRQKGLLAVVADGIQKDVLKSAHELRAVREDQEGFLGDVAEELHGCIFNLRVLGSGGLEKQLVKIGFLP